MPGFIVSIASGYYILLYDINEIGGIKLHLVWSLFTIFFEPRMSEFQGKLYKIFQTMSMEL